jgi:hypothetical protein
MWNFVENRCQIPAFVFLDKRQQLPNFKLIKEVSLAHLVRKVDVQPSHPGLSHQGRRFWFLLFQKKIIVGDSPTVFLSKKVITCEKW